MNPSETGAALRHPRANVSEQAYQYLRSLVMAGELSPNEVVTERRLADRLNTSRTPLRTAINRLEAEGLLERLSNGSLVIRQVAVDELMEILMIRRLLESEAAGQAAQQSDASDIAAMMDRSRAVLEDPEIEFGPFWDYDDAFHLLIARGSGKPLLSSMIRSLRDRARMCHVIKMEKNFERQACEHIAILDALSSGDPEAARAAMADHIDKVRLRLIHWLSGASNHTSSG